MDYRRFCLLLAIEAFLVAVFGFSRALAYWGHRSRFPGIRSTDLVKAFLIGSRMDLAVTGYLVIPLALMACLTPAGLFQAQSFQILIRAYLGVVFFLVLLGVIVEFYYFQEYGAKFNQIFLEYARPQREVMSMIWHDYPILGAMLGMSLLTVATLFAVDPLLVWAGEDKATLASLSVQFALAAAWLIGGCRGLGHRPIGVGAYEFSNSQSLNQLAANGLYQVFRIGYDERRHGGRVAKLFSKMPAEEAAGRVRALIGAREADFTRDGINPLDRTIRSPYSARRPNVVFVLLESHAASYIGALGANPGVTPAFDLLAAEGLLFTRMYANGDRTARGIESVICSFPPLPGMSTLKRAGAHGRMFGAARCFEQRGYRTRFYYGGDAAYDNMRGFALTNGFESVFERKDVRDPAWETSWGVSDENLYDQVLDDIEAQGAEHPLFAFVLTISNHRPYTWPPGLFEPIRPESKIAGAFQYADYAMGRLIERARASSAGSNTVFVFVADHGIAVHGRSLVPVERFHIPLLILAPTIPEIAPRKIETLCSQVDVLPTVLGLLGGESRTCGFGRDLLALDSDLGCALLHYYGAYAYLRGDRALMLRPHAPSRLFEFCRDEPGGRVGSPIKNGSIEMEREAVSILSLAERLYREGRYRF